MRAFVIGVASTLVLLTTGAGCADRRAAAAGCRAPVGDSARAACVAVDTVARASGFASRVLSAERTADGGFRVRTAPADSNHLDGMGLVVTDRAGRVRSVTLGDSL